MVDVYISVFPERPSHLAANDGGSGTVDKGNKRRGAGDLLVF
jgi:hypothetical protein